MTSINFYRINGDVNAAQHFACQLTEKAFKQGLTVLLHTQELSVSEQLGTELWSFNPLSFLPHEQEDVPTASIAISHHDNPGEHHGLLINLGSSTPGWFSRFEKVVEIVYDDQQVIEQKRECYGLYQNRGYPLKYHDLTKPS